MVAGFKRKKKAKRRSIRVNEKERVRDVLVLHVDFVSEPIGLTTLALSRKIF
jgi:hypothetical protein